MTGYPLKTPGQIYADNPLTPAITDLVLLWKTGALGAVTLSELLDFIAVNLPISDEIQAKFDEILGGAPAALDTLNELAAAIGDDADYAGTITAALAGKLVKAQNLSDLTDKPLALSNLGAQANLGWKPVQIVDISTPVSAIVLAMPAGAKALRMSGKVKLSTTTDAVRMRFSIDGGVTYFSASGDYKTGYSITNAGTESNTPIVDADAFILANANAGAGAVTSFSAQLDSGGSIPSFHAENSYANGHRTSFGYSSATGANITHVQIFPFGGATFVAGTRFLAEAF